MKNEATVQNELRLAVADLGGDAYRNNSGVLLPVSQRIIDNVKHALKSGNISQALDILEDISGRPQRFGLGNDSSKINKVRKSSDLICCYPVVVTQSMVGHIVGVMLVVDAKREGWKFKGNETETGQFNFMKKIRGFGGIGCFAQSVNDLHFAINEWFKRFN